MGEHSKWRNYNQDGLRRRYMALLVPALAKVHADHPHGSAQLQRAQAVRRAADTCLVQALAKINSSADHPQQQLVIQRPAHHTCLRPAPAASSSSRLRFKASPARRGSFSCRLHALIIRGKETAKAKRSSGSRTRTIRLKENWIKHGARAALCRTYRCRSSSSEIRKNRRRNHDDREKEEGSIPEESELRRLQSVLFPKKNSTEDGSTAAAGDDQEGYRSCSAINPAVLLSQAAHYIMALQVQVDALRSLASLSVDSAPSLS
eukprot:c14938_g1_i1 orf=309-1094(-)